MAAVRSSREVDLLVTRSRGASLRHTIEGCSVMRSRRRDADRSSEWSGRGLLALTPQSFLPLHSKFQQPWKVMLKIRECPLPIMNPFYTSFTLLGHLSKATKAAVLVAHHHSSKRTAACSLLTMNALDDVQSKRGERGHHEAF
jgi:hypothetical protein